VETLRRNRTLLITLAILAFLLFTAIQGLSTRDWVITLLRGISVGAITFLVASGLSLIFGLLDVLNLAHGTLFMIGAYVGWTTYLRPDTLVDLLPPVLLLAAGLLLGPFWAALVGRWRTSRTVSRAWPWAALILAVALATLVFAQWPLARWDPAVAAQSPATYSLQLDQAIKAGQARAAPAPAAQGGLLRLAGAFLGSALLALGLAGFSAARYGGAGKVTGAPRRWALGALLLVTGVGIYTGDAALTRFLFGLDTAWLFLIALLVALVTGAALGALMEITLIRPLYTRPIYQLMLTLGLGVSGIELVQAIWGRTEFNMPKPALFQGSGAGCPATSIVDWLANGCSTIDVLGGRIRTYNELFVILIGVIVLVAVSVLLQRSRLGMIIRAGVQDSEMVEALGINVRQVFTLVFALGAALATLGGIIAAPSMGLSPLMGESLLLAALIALAIGGLTSFPGAAAGSLLVGLVQQFIIKYGQIGIRLPFLEQPFKPTPPLVPASTVLLMVIILLVLPQGLFGRKE